MHRPQRKWRQRRRPSTRSPFCSWNSCVINLGRFTVAFFKAKMEELGFRRPLTLTSVCVCVCEICSLPVCVLSGLLS